MPIMRPADARRGTSIYLGVTKNSGGRWVSQICIDNRTQLIGIFDNEFDAGCAFADAARAYDDYCVKIGQPRVNFPK